MTAGLSAVLLGAGVSWLGTLRIHLSDIAPTHYVLPAFGLIGGLIAGILIEHVPEASGSGIPQVRAALDRVRVVLDLRVAIVKLLGGIFALGSGLFLGREGPTVQLGAAVAAPLSRLIPTAIEHRRQLIAAGAGAGLTAAFNAPLAGVIFVLEELLKEIKPTTVTIAVVACSVSCLILNLLSPPHLRLPVHSLNTEISFALQDIPFYLFLGVVAGLLGALFNGGIFLALKFNKNVLRIPGWLKVGIAGLLSGLVMSFLPTAFHDYAGMRALIIGGQTNLYTVIVAFLGFYFLTMIAYGSGAPGGLFAPALALGSALGFLVGYLEHALTGSGSTATFALVGMGAFFAAIARVPLTAIAITFELTTNFTLLTPLMITCVVSTIVGDLISSGSLYDRLMSWSGIQLHGPEMDKEQLVLKAKDVLRRKSDKNPDSLPSTMPIKDALPLFSNSNQRGFPVVDNGKLVGVITQTDLSKVTHSESDESLFVADIMTPHPVVVSPYDSLEDILFLFSRHKFTWLPVVSHDRLQGVILQSDVVQTLFSQSDAPAPGKAGDNGTKVNHQSDDA